MATRAASGTSRTPGSWWTWPARRHAVPRDGAPPRVDGRPKDRSQAKRPPGSRSSGPLPAERGGSDLAEDEATAVRGLEREGIAPGVVEGVDHEVIVLEVARVLRVGEDGNALGLPECDVEAVEHRVATAQDRIRAAA